MSTALHIVLIVLSVAAVAIGDIFLKKASLAGDFTRAVGSQWMVFAVVLNLYQIVFVTYVFVPRRPSCRSCRSRSFSSKLRL